jgi:hypothetical protein
MAVNPSNIEHAIVWVKEMRRWSHAMPPTFVMPGTTGEVILEWRGDSYHLVAELSNPSQVEWLLNIPGEAMKQWETDGRRSWIVRSEE